jgi:hypothetical protein
MTTATTVPTAFAVNEEATSALLHQAAANADEHHPDHAEGLEIWPRWRPEVEAGMTADLIRLALEAGALTTVPGWEIVLETDDSEGSAWYLWRVTGPGSDMSTTPAGWAELAYLGDPDLTGTARVRTIIDEAASVGNQLAAVFTPGALVIPLPPGVTAGEFLQDLIDGLADAVTYRDPDDADYCGDCVKTEKPGGGTDVIYCDDHATDHESAGIYAKAQRRLEHVHAGKL